MTSTSQCWFCSEEIRATDRTKVVADLNVVVHAGCFDRLYDTTGPTSWSSERRPPAHNEPNDDGEEDKTS